jgi:hypothetical protein
MAASEPKELWLIPGMSHAEASCGQGLTDRIGRWVQAAVTPGETTGSVNGAHRGEDTAPRPRETPASTPNAAA